MSRILTLTKRELKESFESPLLYILSAAFIFVMGLLFFNYLVSVETHTSFTLEKRVFIPFFGSMNFLFLFISPIITMGSFAEENKNGTLDLLLLSKLTTFEIIWAKFLSKLTILTFLLSLTSIFPIIIYFAGFETWPLILSSYGGMVFNLACYVFLGLFCSSITKSQILAALLSICIVFSIVLLIFTANSIDNFIVAQILQYLSIPFHYESFVRAAFKSYNIIYFLSFIGTFYYLTKISLISRKW